MKDKISYCYDSLVARKDALEPIQVTYKEIQDLLSLLNDKLTAEENQLKNERNLKASEVSDAEKAVSSCQNSINTLNSQAREARDQADQLEKEWQAKLEKHKKVQKKCNIAHTCAKLIVRLVVREEHNCTKCRVSSLKLENNMNFKDLGEKKYKILEFLV